MSHHYLRDAGGTGRSYALPGPPPPAAELIPHLTQLTTNPIPDLDVLALETLRRTLALADAPCTITPEGDHRHRLDFTFRGFAPCEPLATFNREVFGRHRARLAAAIGHTIGLSPAESEDLFATFHQLEHQAQLRLFLMLARALHAAPFENLSRVLDGVPARPGHEAWPHFAAGGGGVCVEKTAALAFFCDVLELEHHHVAGTGSPLPPAFETELAAYVAAGGPPPTWIAHHLLRIRVANRWLFIDPTGGTLPLRVLDDDDFQQLCTGGMRVRLAFRSEKFFLRHLTGTAGATLLDLTGFAAPELIPDYLLRQSLGLRLSPDCLLDVMVDWGGPRSRICQHAATARATAIGLPPPLLVHDDQLQRCPDPNLATLLAQLSEPLRRHLCRPHYSGRLLFIYQPLTHSWRREQISPSICRTVQTIPKSPAVDALSISEPLPVPS